MISEHCHCNDPLGAAGEPRTADACRCLAGELDLELVSELGPETRPGLGARSIVVRGDGAGPRPVAVEVRA